MKLPGLFDHLPIATIYNRIAAIHIAMSKEIDDKTGVHLGSGSEFLEHFTTEERR